MSYVLFFIGVIVIFYIGSSMHKKIDEEEAAALAKDGHAQFIRSRYPHLVEEVIDLTGWPIGKERDDAVFIRQNESEYIGLLQYSGMLSVVYVNNKQLIQEWKYSVGTSNAQILSDIGHYVGKYSN